MIEDDAAEKDDVKPDSDAVASVDLEPTEPVSEKSPWKAFVFTGLLAGLIGAGGGAFGAYAGLKAQAPDMDAISGPLNTQMETLATRLAKAEADVRIAKNRPTPTSTPVDLSAIEARLSNLESEARADIDPTAIAALKAAQADGFAWPDISELEARVSALETQVTELLDTAGDALSSNAADNLMIRLEQLETAVIDAPAPQIDPAVTDSLSARLSALENRAPAAPKIERIAVLAFPKAALMDAIEDNTQGGFMKKALSKHVRVKDEDNPVTLIDGIEADIAKGRLDAAANKFERLPVPVQAAGQAWYESVKASL